MILVQAPARPTRGATAKIAFGATMGNLLGITCTVSAMFGVLLVPIAEEFAWSRTAVAGAFAATALATAVAMPLAGRAIDRWGARPVLIAGFLLLGLAIMALATIRPDPLTYYLTFAVAGVAGALPSNAALAKILSEWFDQKRGFWLGITAGVGNGVGATIMPMIAATLAAQYGFRGAFLGIGALVVLLGVPIAWLTLRPPPQFVRSDVPEEALLTGLTVAQTLRRPLFWLIVSAVPVVAGSLTGVFANTVPIMLSHALTLPQAMSVVAAFALICTIGQPLAGWLLDRHDRPRIVAAFYVASAVGLTLLIVAKGFAALVLAGALVGIGLGADYCVMTYILSRYFGLRAMGTLTGIAFAVVLLFIALTPLALNLAFDRLGSYGLPLAVIAVMMVYTIAVFALLPRYPARFED